MSEKIAKYVDDNKKLWAHFFKTSSDYNNSIDCAKDYCELLNSLLKKLYSEIAYNIRGVALCSFGSLARNEMLGQSDLDIMLIHDNEIDIDFLRENLITKLQAFEFSKLDIPKWGALSECEKYLAHAITEGNQVVEAKFIVGDETIWRKLDKLKHKYCTKERFRSTFLFQYLYFNQYYKQRKRENSYNLKYGHGGTRDFLFPVWLANLREGFQYSQQRSASIVCGVQSLVERGNLSSTKAHEYLDAINIVSLIRNELIRASIDTQEPGLTYLNHCTANTLSRNFPQVFLNKEMVLQSGLDATRKIFELKKLCYQIFMSLPDIKERIGTSSKISPSDELGAISLSWKLDLSSISKSYLDLLLSNNSWAVMTSLACNPTCSKDTLEYLALLGLSPGFEYVLKVVARNQNTLDATLKSIAYSSVELRFREPAITRLEKGWKKSNELQ